MSDLTSETDFACMTCYPQIKHQAFYQITEGGENAGPFWTKTKTLPLLLKFCIFVPRLAFLIFGAQQ